MLVAPLALVSFSVSTFPPLRSSVTVLQRFGGDVLTYGLLIPLPAISPQHSNRDLLRPTVFSPTPPPAATAFSSLKGSGNVLLFSLITRRRSLNSVSPLVMIVVLLSVSLALATLGP